MTIELYDAINEDGFFDVVGKAFDALSSILTPAGSTVPTKVETYLAQFQLRADSDDLDVSSAMEGLPAAVASWQRTTNALTSLIRLTLERLLRELVAEDAAQPEDTLQYALEYLIDQMETDGDYVADNTIGFTLTPGGSNVADLAVCYSGLRGDGRINENILAESLAVTTKQASTQTLRFRGTTKQPDRLAHNWPLASGIDTSLRATSPAASLLSNGDFEDETIDDVPDNWMVHVGTPGTTVKITATEVQTVVISGSPTAGSYLLQYTNPEGIKRSTVSLAWNASGSAVQAALRALPGLAAVTVATTGTSPNYTHTITFTGTNGDPVVLGNVKDLTGGTPVITHATTVASHGGVYRDKALEFDSDGAEVSAIYHPLSLSPQKVYFVHLRVLRVGACAAGEVRIEIVDEIDGSVIADDQSNDASLTLTAADIDATTHDSESFSFRLPANTSFPVYLRIRISTAVSNTCSIVFDEVAVVAGTELYPGGLYVAVFEGATLPDPADVWTLAMTNDRAAGIQEWCNRVYGMADKGLLLPISGGGDLIPPSWP